MNEEFKNIQPLDNAELNGTSGGANQARWVSYTVKPGDTLAKIANRFGVSVADICKWNGIPDPDLIVVGRRLNIYINR